MVAVRAAVAQAHLTGVEADVVPGVREALEQMPPEAIAMIRSASRVAWIEMEPNFLLNEGIFRAVGVAGGRDFYRKIYTDFFNGPLFGTFFAGVRALGKPNPGSSIKHSPRAWEMLWRGLGRVEVSSRTSKSIELTFHDQPGRLFEPQLPWFELLAGVFEVAFIFCEVQGSAEVVTTKAEDGFAELRFDW